MPTYRVRVSSISWLTYEVEAKDPTDAARMGWQSEVTEGQEVDGDGRIEEVFVYAGDDRWHHTPLDYDFDAAFDGTEEEEDA